MPAQRPTPTRRVLWVAVAGGVASAVAVELVGHLAGGAATTTAAAGGATVVAAGIGAAFKQHHKRQRQHR